MTENGPRDTQLFGIALRQAAAKTAASLTAGSQTATSQTATASADNQSSVPVAPTAIPQATSIDTASILVSVGEVAYDWHIDTDALS